MIPHMRYETGMTVAAHHHEHKQAGYVISGRYRQTAPGTATELRPGDSYVIPGNVKHSLEVHAQRLPEQARCRRERVAGGREARQERQSAA